ncbi:MAG: DUF4268 domain-containing protein [Desulfobulbaceae bacterium]|nr:DUF4268 domain-containing protein [Desulfobulbaceae bacterium]
MNKPPLSRLEKVNLRTFWESESLEFTPWLAQEENIALLAETLELGADGLEVEAQEKNVGPFRADILCKDTATGHWVLIENQLEKTDHIHLGQLLTYAAGLNAVTIVWLAEQFTEEHRATLDWLNEITDDRFNFFGLEIELWRIGNSPLAPKFNIISKPNDWTKSVTGAAGRIEAENLTEVKQLQLKYWTAFREHMINNSSIVRPQKALPQHWMYFAIGRSNFWLVAVVNTQNKVIYAALAMGGSDAKAHFHLLHDDKEKYEEIFGGPLEWHELPNRKESRITIAQQFDPWDTNKWHEQHLWLQEQLEKLYKTFSQTIKTLNADDYIPHGEPEISD